MTVAISAGRVPTYLGGVLIIVEHMWTWYRGNWRATAVSSVLQPVLFLLAFGFGFGSIVGPGAGGFTGGVSYLVWLAPALLAVGAVQSSVFECTYPVLSGFEFQRTYHAMTAGPITPGQVAVGHMTWIAAKAAANGGVCVLIFAMFGGVTSAGIVVSLLAAVLAGSAVAALVMAFTASLERENGAFTVLFRIVMIPMVLFSGTFFPIDRLPEWVTPVVWLSPLWHGTELARAAAVDRWELLPALGHLAYLVLLLAVGTALAVGRFTRRLTR